MYALTEADIELLEYFFDKKDILPDDKYGVVKSGSGFLNKYKAEYERFRYCFEQGTDIQELLTSAMSILNAYYPDAFDDWINFLVSLEARDGKVKPLHIKADTIPTLMQKRNLTFRMAFGYYQKIIKDWSILVKHPGYDAYDTRFYNDTAKRQSVLFNEYLWDVWFIGLVYDHCNKFLPSTHEEVADLLSPDTVIDTETGLIRCKGKVYNPLDRAVTNAIWVLKALDQPVDDFIRSIEAWRTLFGEDDNAYYYQWVRIEHLKDEVGSGEYRFLWNYGELHLPKRVDFLTHFLRMGIWSARTQCYETLTRPILLERDTEFARVIRVYIF